MKMFILLFLVSCTSYPEQDNEYEDEDLKTLVDDLDKPSKIKKKIRK